MLKKIIIQLIIFMAFLNAGVEEKMQELLNNNKAPGMNFSIIYEDGSQESFSSGYADLENKILMTPDHLMFSGSIGKTYAVAALMQLVDEGKIDLNKKFVEYFPNHKWLNKLPNIKDFTVLHLLQHRSGLPRYAFKPEVWKTVLNDPDKIWSYKDRLKYVFDEKAVHKAGEGFAYSDTGYLLLGMLIEKITDKYLYNAVFERVVYPLKLNKTFPADRRILPNHSNTYSKAEVFNINGYVFNKGVCIYNPQIENTGGGWTSTTSDLAKWAKHYYLGKPFSENSKKVIQTISPNGKNVFDGGNCGAGIFILETKFGNAYGHTGLMTGTRSIMLYFPEINIAAAMQLNCDVDVSKLGLLGQLEILIDEAIKQKQK